MSRAFRYVEISATEVPAHVMAGRWDASRGTAGSIVTNHYAATDWRGHTSTHEAGYGATYMRRFDASDRTTTYYRRAR